MEGWKTWVAMLLGVATGIGMVCTGLLSDPMDFNLIGQGLLVIAAALGIGGVGHKIDKLRKTMSK